MSEQLPILKDQDVSFDPILDKTIAIIGFGNQGHAHAANLRDRGAKVIVGARDGSPSGAKAAEQGFELLTISEAVLTADVVMLLTPDEVQPQVFQEHIEPFLKAGQTLGFCHGFCLHYSFIIAPDDIDVILAAPVGPGHLLRSRFVNDEGLPCITAVHQDSSGKARETALAYAAALGGGRVGIIETTIKNEVETDLFGEQSVICGGVSELITKGVETLTEAGYPAELAYFECAHQMKLLADLIFERGVAGMREAISNTAKYGDLTRGPRIINDETKARMKEVLKEVQSGAFAEEWMSEHESGQRKLQELMRKAKAHPMEAVGHRLRNLDS